MTLFATTVAEHQHTKPISPVSSPSIAVSPSNFPKLALDRQLICHQGIASLADLQQEAFELVQQAASQQLNYIEVCVPFVSFAQQLQQPILVVMETVIAGLTLGAKATQVKVHLIAELVAATDDSLFLSQVEQVMLLRPKLVAVALSATTAHQHQAALPKLLHRIYQTQWPLWLFGLDQQADVLPLIQMLKPSRITADWQDAAPLLHTGLDASMTCLLTPSDDALQALKRLPMAQQAQIAFVNHTIAELCTQEPVAFCEWLNHQALKLAFLSESEQKALCYRFMSFASLK